MHAGTFLFVKFCRLMLNNKLLMYILEWILSHKGKLSPQNSKLFTQRIVLGKGMEKYIKYKIGNFMLNNVI